MEATNNEQSSHWHLDKKVPISLIVALFVQFGAGLWFISKLEARVLALETSSLGQHQRDELQDAATRETAALLRADLAYIRSQLDQLLREARGGNKP